MKLLILTQAVDLDDPVLGFFHRWIEVLAERVESVHVICLKEGRHVLPQNVQVHSLGKEGGRSRFKYMVRFYRYIWTLRDEYDAVFVHMNQEYVILGGWFWRAIHKRVFLWRNYHQGNIFTTLAVAFCTKVFCTSKHSYTAHYKKTILMPVGVDTTRFFPETRIQRLPRSILFMSGMWPSKRPEMLLEALIILHARGIEFTADFYGSPLPETEAYYASLKAQVVVAELDREVIFYAGIPNEATSDVYRKHDLFVNCSPSGMFDKTLFEAAASGCRVLAASLDFGELAGTEARFDSVQTLAARLETALKEPPLGEIPAFVQKHSLSMLAERLVKEL